MVPKWALPVTQINRLKMSTSNSSFGTAQRATVMIRPDENLVPPSMQAALEATPKLKSKPLAADSLAELCAQLGTSTATAAAVTATITTTATTATTATTITTATVSSSARNGNPSGEQVLVSEALPCLPLPPESRFNVFRWAVRMNGPESSLFSLSKASKGGRGDVIAFLNHDVTGLEFRASLRHGDIPKWKRNANDLVSNAKALRQSARHIDFTQWKPGAMPAFDLSQDLPDHGVIKIAASGIGRARVVDEALRLLETVPSYARVALDLSDNCLNEQDLELLLIAMERKPVVYQLSLDNNPLCQGDQVCMPLVKLFSQLGPSSHLYLTNVGLNDATAECIQAPLANSQTLLHLDLRNNRLTEAGAITIVASVVPRTCLDTLRLQGNQFGLSEAVSSAINRAHLGIEENMNSDPTEEAYGVEIIQIGVMPESIQSSAMQTAEQKMYDDAALAERI